MKKKKTKKKKKIGLAIILTIVGIVVLVVGLVVGLYFHYAKKLNADSVAIVEKPTEEPVSVYELNTPMPEDVAAEYTEATPEPTEYPIWAVDSIDNRIINILLAGIDYRDDEDKTVASSDTLAASDSMMLVSVNLETNRVCIFSIMRDGGAYITNKSWYDKINKAYANYGIGGLINCVNGEKNFDLDVQNYIVISFRMFTHILKHYFGNVDIELTKEECQFINKWAEWDMLEVKDGVQSVPPYGVLFYCRDRYGDGQTGGDWGRTARQRHVLELLYEKAKKEMSLTTLAGLVDYVATTAKTNLTGVQMLQLAQIALSGDFHIESTTIPFPGMGKNGTNSSGSFLLSYDMKKAREILHGIIYNGDPMPEKVSSSHSSEPVDQYKDKNKDSKGLPEDETEATPKPKSTPAKTEDESSPEKPAEETEKPAGKNEDVDSGSSGEESSGEEG